MLDKSLESTGSSKRVSLGRQLYLLTARAWISYWRDTVYNTTRLLITGLWYLFLGGVFRGIVRNDFASVQVRDVSKSWAVGVAGSARRVSVLRYGQCAVVTLLCFFVVMRVCMFQSALGIIILLCGFMGVGYLLMNATLITRIRESFYRETSSNTYHGALFPIAYLLVELVWLAVLCLEVGR